MDSWPWGVKVKRTVNKLQNDINEFYNYLKFRLKYEKVCGSRKEYVIIEKMLNKYIQHFGIEEWKHVVGNLYYILKAAILNLR